MLGKSSVVAVVTGFAFLTAMLWPYAVRADKAPPPPPPPAAQPASPPIADEAMSQAKQHFEAGRNAYNAGDFVTAIREFKAAEALRPSAILAYNIGLANQQLGKKRVAMKYYHRYLEQLPTAQNRAEVEGRITQLEQEIAAQQPATPPPGSPPPPPGQPGGPNGMEQPGDMPPPQAGGQQPTSGYDPYASTSAPPPTAPPPQKKKSYWWVWLIVAAGATIVIGVIVAVAVVYGNTVSPTFAADRAMLTNTRDPASSGSRTPSTLLPLFHF